MWLINTTTLRLEQVLEPRTKRYAILSHTWGSDEVSFQEFADLDMAKKKPGFSKIKRTCQLAASRDLEYAWIDTCCIDKTSSAELAEAINSMFEWYKQSKVCFAFIADLPPVDREDLDWLARRQYRWFTRGWTLQELIAPRKLEFFDSTWKFRGDKFILRSKLSLKTDIDMSVLKDSTYLSRIPVGRRMSWASARKTQRSEDMAYCLLGIFGINMPLIYGEGTKAFVRLQEEIAKEHNDLSLFCWIANSGCETKSELFRGILATSPSEFAHFSEIEVYNDYLSPNPEFSLTNNGLRMEAKLGLGAALHDVLALDCLIVPAGPPPLSSEWLGIYLRKTGSGYVRQYPHKLFRTADSSTWSGKRTIIYIRKSVGTEETLTELAGRIYIRYLPATPSCSIEDVTSSPEALWIPNGAYFLTMESFATGDGSFYPLFTGFKRFNIHYEGAQLCSCLLICGIFPNARGDFRPIAVIYVEGPDCKGLFDLVKKHQHEQNDRLFPAIRRFVISKHARTSMDGILSWEDLCNRETQVGPRGRHITISLTLKLVTDQRDESLGGEERHLGELQLGPDIRYLPDQPSESTSAESNYRQYVVSVRVEGGYRNLRLH